MLREPETIREATKGYEPSVIIPRRLHFAGMIRQVGRSAWALYSILCAHASKVTGECFPSYIRIAELTGMSYATIHRGKKKLERLGYIRVEKRRTKDRAGNEWGRLKNHYTIIDNPGGAPRRTNEEIMAEYKPREIETQKW